MTSSHLADARLRDAVCVSVAAARDRTDVGVRNSATVEAVYDMDVLVCWTRDRQRSLVLTHDSRGWSEATVYRK